MNRKGFTLIELLVVIAIIAMLLAIILPSLSAAKEMATGAVCVSRQKQLMTAWISYTTDNDSFLVGGSNYSPTSPGGPKTPYRWVEFPMDDNGNNVGTPFYSFETRKNGIRFGAMWPYTGDEDLYHCPGDRTMVKQDEPEAAFRSYEIVGLMNSEHFVSRVDPSDIFSPIKEYSKSAIRPGGPTVELKVAIKDSDVRSPGTKLVFVEEDVTRYGSPYNTSCWGGWMLFQSGYSWWDSPAHHHKEASTFGFADGHAEKHKWKDEDTLALIMENTNDPEPLENEDLLWLAKGYVSCR